MRQVLALALYVAQTLRQNRETAEERNPDTEMHRVRNLMLIVDYGVARGGIRGSSTQQVTCCLHASIMDIAQPLNSYSLT